MSEPFERPGMRIPTWEEIKKFLADRPLPAWEVTPGDTPDRHKDYLPLNLWDETQD